MTLKDLLYGLTPRPLSPIAVGGVSCHSKQVRPGDLFVAVSGAEEDGHVYIDEAVQRGAAAVVAERRPSRSHQAFPCVVVPDAREALSLIAERFYGHPTERLKLLGVTGTNGKTTIAHLMKSILDESGRRAGLLGTVVYQIGERLLPSTNTTPGSLDLQRYFAQMVAEGIEWCAMEVSSHALDQRRVARLQFEAAVCSNLGSDHLDYHKTMEAYAASKRKLFDYLAPKGKAVVNVDDAFGRSLVETLPNRTVISYGLEHAALVRARNVQCTWDGITLTLETPWTKPLDLTTTLIGRHNAYNVAAASAVLLSCGLPGEQLRSALAQVAQIPGRLERVANDHGVQVVIDYAHTADALRLLLLSLRELTRGRLIAVFGCGGDRDESKRPVMGRMAGLLADQVVLTSDNPRTESPQRILEQIQSGFPQSFSHFQVIADREQAILFDDVNLDKRLIPSIV